jgi:hypothetical protein
MTDARIDVHAEPGVVRAAAHVKWMSMDLAPEFCDAIQSTARESRAVGLVMDLGSLSRATPRAGLYAMKALKEMPVRRIALVGGNAFMRTFARVTLSLGNFPEFSFFDSPEAASSWAAAAPGR